MHRCQTRAIVAAIAMALTVALNGCTDDDPSADPTTGASTDSPSSGDPTSPIESSTTSSAIGESVAPATGPLLSMSTAEVNAPQGWELFPRRDPNSKSAVEAEGMSSTQLGEQVSSGDGNLDQLRESGDPRLKDQPNVILDGVEAFHVAGSTGAATWPWTDIVGAVNDGMYVQLTISYDADTKPTERKKIFASMLATFRWK